MAFIQKRKNYELKFLLTIVLLFVLIIVSSAIGIANITFSQTMNIILSRVPFVNKLISQDYISSTHRLIILNIRLPRIVLSAFIGAGLALVGTAFQAIFKNPMADPYVLGISSGASLGATIAIITGIEFAFKNIGMVTIFAFIGAISTTFIVYNIARVGGKIPINILLLAGVAISFLFSSLVYLMMIFNREQIEKIIFWTMGSVSEASFTHVLLVLPFVLIGGIIIYVFARDLNLMLTGDETALTLGIEVETVKKLILVVSSLIIAACVSVSGIIGFVGLIIPHILRIIVGPDHKILLPFSAVGGAIFMIICDTLARSLVPPIEIPVGAITSLFGAPYFIYLLVKKKKQVN
ncbi:FecCD family ABC transporter permease [Clostridium ganghwense]|uniref:Iron chelate uptake ABC transporter family permease subunit n=1 Tax=Clostridium ganghwense TaxID=312089 RepID=A0ABT4CNU7_9CLOT|nr:iron chelate uptake ABC transporter family permease subunit [Clostridium ganghwense]MCY6369644.1 iron chelate uptake ABC transporter family permease subunit [Clostridium ganghwense]